MAKSGPFSALAFRSAFDPKRTFVELRGSAGMYRKSMVSILCNPNQYAQVSIGPSVNLTNEGLKQKFHKARPGGEIGTG
jgi:hypothetical protein